MTVREFLQSHAGKGTVGVTLMALILVVPPSINFLAAAWLLAWAIRHLRAAFTTLEAEERAESASRDLATQPGREMDRAA